MIKLAGYDFVDFKGPACAKAAPGCIAIARRFATPQPPEVVAAFATKDAFTWLQAFVRKGSLSAVVRKHGAPGVAVVVEVRTTCDLHEAEAIAAQLDPEAADLQQKGWARKLLEAQRGAERARLGVVSQLRLLSNQLSLLMVQVELAALVDRAK